MILVTATDAVLAKKKVLSSPLFPLPRKRKLSKPRATLANERPRFLYIHTVAVKVCRQLLVDRLKQRHPIKYKEARKNALVSVKHPKKHTLSHLNLPFQF